MSDLIERLRAHAALHRGIAVDDDDEQAQWAQDLLTAADEIERLTAELETERMRLAACGVVALANTQTSAAKAREMLPEYRSASLTGVERAVDREMKLRAERDEARAERDALRIELDVCRSAIEDCYDIVKTFDCYNDSDDACQRVTLRRLNEAIGKAAPRLLYERSEGQKLYGLRYRELMAERDALHAVATDAHRDIDDLRRQLAESRAEREAMANVLPGYYYMDPPDGGNVPVLEQLRRMAKDAERYRFLSCKGVPPYFHRCSRWRLEYWNGEWWDPLMKEELDAAIDAQIEKEERP